MSDAPPQGETVAPVPPPPRPVTPPPRGGRGIALAITAAVLVVIALVAAAPFWAPDLMRALPWGAAAERAAATADRAAEEAQQLQQLQQRLGAIEQRLGGLATLNDRLGVLERRPQPDSTAAMAALMDQVQQLTTRLDRIDDRMTQLARQQGSNAESPQRVLMLALAGLGNAIAGSGTYTAQLKSVEALAQNRPGWANALRPLEASAESGIPSLAVLTQRFATQTAAAIERADQQKPTANQSLVDAALARLRGLVSIRRVDEAGAGTSPTDRAVALAKAALDHGDLAGAVAALASLEGAPAEAASGWVQDAKRRLAANQTLAKLSAELAADLAAGASGG